MKNLYEKPSMAINTFNVTEITNIDELSSISYQNRTTTSITGISKDGIVKLDLSKLNS